MSLFLANPSSAYASGWNDYVTTIAPGFTIDQMNSFMVCLAGNEGLFLVCPEGQVGPIAEYAVTEDSIVTRNVGAKVVEGDPGRRQIDPNQEFFFLVRRADEAVTGPLTKVEWEEAGLPNLSSLQWIQPRNPNFGTRLLGNLLFFGFIAAVYGIPLIVLATAVFAFRRYRRGARRGKPSHS